MSEGGGNAVGGAVRCDGAGDDARRDRPDTGPIDEAVLDRIRRRLDGNPRFERVVSKPGYAPNAVVATYDLGYFPPAVSRSSLRIRWYVTDGFTIHYTERYDDRAWECRWDRHPNPHNTRGHVHPPPDAAMPGEDASFPADWRDVLERVLAALDERIEAFWGGT